MKEKIYFQSKVKKSKTPIQETIESLGIVYPNSSLGFAHSIFASVDGVSANGNGVILAESVAEDVSKLKFCQCNMNHKREKGIVLGSILNAWVNPKTKDIEIVFSFFKSLYPKLWEKAQEDMENGELTVSFELTVNKKDIEVVQGNKRKLHHVDFDGVGILFSGTPPAYKKAHVLQLAKQDKTVQIANEIVESVFNKMKTDELVFASAKDAVDKMEQTSKMIESEINKGGNGMDKKANDALLAKFKEDLIAELGDEVKDWTDEQFLAELDKRAKAEESAQAEAETPSEETKADEKAEEETVETEEEVADEEVEKEENPEEVKEEEAEEVKEEEKAEDAIEESKMEKQVVETKETVNQKITFDPENK
jgi:hypothetical protein